MQNSSLEAGFFEIRRNAETDAYANLLHEIRSALILNMEETGVSRARLARKLNVSRSVISRVLDPTSDVLISTLFDLAWALRKIWIFSLQSLEIDEVNSSDFQYETNMSESAELPGDVLDDSSFITIYSLEFAE